MSDTIPGWVYDIVMDKHGTIVALMYHPTALRLTADCLGSQEMESQLDAEGLTVDCSGNFETLEKAKAAAWAEHEKFAKDLD